ncbi:MAG TPA: hypothetical protein DG761_00215, partial [Gammaproteobacteria bacterium]|nr:hypothetical protein [Gammaproteobacteria bacterium]
MDFQRLILFGALGMVLLLLWQSWLEYESGKNGAAMNANTPASQVSGAAQDTTTATKPEADDVPQAPAVSAAPETSDTAAAIPLSQSLPGERRVIAETDIIRAEIDTRGGDLRRLALLTYPVSLDEPDTPFVLLNDSGADLFLIQDGLLSAGREAPNHHTIFSTERQNVRLSPGEDSVQVHLEWTSDDGVVFRKTFTFHRNSYYIDVAFTVDNQSSDQWVGYRYSQILRTQVAEPSSGFGFLGRLPSYKGGAIFTPEDKYQKIDFEEMYEANLARSTTSGWVAMLQHYFVGALLPSAGTGYEFYSNVTRRDSGPRYLIGYKTTQPTAVPAR